MPIVPVVLAGGSGTRLWPWSREAHPKQFLTTLGPRSLFQDTLLRAFALPNSLPPVILLNEAHYFLAADQLQALQASSQAQFILEPLGRNTAPAVALVAHWVQAHYPSESVMVIMPADHWIADISGFSRTIFQAVDLAHKGHIVTCGVVPTEPKTGYGYIETGKSLKNQGYTIQRFIEKPDLETAQALLSTGKHYWNSGIFILKSAVYLHELSLYHPDMAVCCQAAYQSLETASHWSRLSRAAWQACPSDSIDYVVMERTKKGAMVPLTSAWQDLGCWNAIAELSEPDAEQNVLQGKVVSEQNEGCFLSSEQQLIAAIGLKNVLVVSTPDAVLVADKAYTQEIKQLVNRLKATHPEVTECHRQVYRPWGSYELLFTGERFQVKRLKVKPGAQLSLQIHHHRAEHWVVIQGEATVTNGSQQLVLNVNQSTYIPPDTQHRLMNQTQVPLVLIEVQTGSYLGEDDIIRLEDIYGRIQTVDSLEQVT